MAFGVTAAGFVLKTQQDIEDELVAALRARFGGDINTSSASVLGQTVKIFSAQLAEAWEVALADYRSMYPDSATDEALDNVAAIVGLTRLPATRSTVDLLLNLADTTAIPAGSLVGVGAAGNEFRTTADVSNTSGAQALTPAEAESVELGPIIANADTLDTIKTPAVGWTAKTAIVNDTAETYALVNGQTLTIKVDDGAEQTALFETADFAAIGAATAAEVAAVIDADITGASSFELGTTGFVFLESDTDGAGSVLEVTGGTANPVLAFDTTRRAGMNRLDAALGRNIETDPDFRARRASSLQVIGAGTVEAIRARLLTDVDGVTAALIFENDTDAVDGDGRPAHSFEPVVQGGTDQDIIDLLWLVKPAGIESFGTISGTAEDSQGDPQDISFSRPVEVDIYVEIDVEVDGTYPVTGDDILKQALVDYGDALGIGTDVYISKLYCPASTVGVVNITRIEIGETAVVAGLDIAIDPTEISEWDTSRIIVSAVVL